MVLVRERLFFCFGWCYVVFNGSSDRLSCSGSTFAVLGWFGFDRCRLCSVGLDLFSVVNGVQQGSILSNCFRLFSFFVLIV